MMSPPEQQHPILIDTKSLCVSLLGKGGDLRSHYYCIPPTVDERIPFFPTFFCGRLEVHEGGQQLKREEVSPPTHLWNVLFFPFWGRLKRGEDPPRRGRSCRTKLWSCRQLEPVLARASYPHTTQERERTFSWQMNLLTPLVMSNMKGLLFLFHLFHFSSQTCSQKGRSFLRIFLPFLITWIASFDVLT